MHIAGNGTVLPSCQRPVHMFTMVSRYVHCGNRKYVLQGYSHVFGMNRMQAVLSINVLAAALTANEPSP